MKPLPQSRIAAHPLVRTLAVWLCVCVLSPTPTLGSLGQAVDAPSLTWTTGGAATWVSQATTTHDGVDAAESGMITDFEQSWIETSVTGPGVLVFWWKVSAEYDGVENQGYDSIEFFTNGVSPFPGITGEVDWQLRSLGLPAGTTTLRWSYIKDESDVFPVGQDRAWVDQVTVFTAPFAPIVSVQPQDQAAPLGHPVEFQVQAIGTDPLTYQWRRDGTNLISSGNLSGTESATLSFSAITAEDLDSLYSVVITNAQGGVTSRVATLFLAPTLAEAVDTSHFIWTTGGDLPWFGQTNVTQDGTDAAQSGPIRDNEAHDEESWIQTTIAGPGELRFWWRVASEDNFDTLQFITNGVMDQQISGDSGWQEVSRLLKGETYTLRWRYLKDSIVSWRSDSAWLDHVTLEAPSSQPFVLSTEGFVGSAFQLRLHGEPDRVYRLYLSTNRLDWVPIQTNSDSSGLVPFSDPTAGGASHRYYRAETD